MNVTLNNEFISKVLHESALTPEALSSLITVSVPTELVTIKGIATEIRYWPKAGTPTKIYGRLGIGRHSIRFELQPHILIRENDPVILHGTLRVKQADEFKTTHEVILTGDVVGGWLPRIVTPEIQLPESGRQKARITVETILGNYGVEGFGFLVSDTAWGDLTNAAISIPALSQCRRIVTSFSNPDRFITDLRDLCKDSSIQALVITRGGGKDLDVIGNSHDVISELVSCGIAFYTALGHNADVLLLDKYADQTFSTPSSFGSALSNAARSIDEHRKTAERERELAKNYEKLELENLELKRAAAATGTAYFTKSKHQEVEFSEFGMRRGGKIIIFAGCVLLAYLVGLLT